MSDLEGPGGTVHVWWSTGRRSATAAVLRAALAEHMELPPERVPLGRDPTGRPVVGGGSALEVSVSHTSGLVLVAVGLGWRLGVDVELVRERPLRLLPAHALAESELAVLERCAPEKHLHALLRYWVRKEALLKAAGVGLAIDPRAVEVSGPAESARVVSLPETLGRPVGWTLVDLEIDGYVAALAVEGPSPRTVLRELAA
jgi:4'-phosphopantetheinyl transferase